MEPWKRQHSKTEVQKGRDRRIDCLACHDTGIITNGDGMLGQVDPAFKNYDSRFDVPLICQCHKAFSHPIPSDSSEPKFKAGYRSGFGINEVVGERGSHKFGCNVDKTVVEELHRLRLEAWNQTEDEWVRARAENRRPYFIEEQRHHLESIGSILKTIRPEDDIASPKFHGAPTEVHRPDLPRFSTVQRPYA